MDDRPELLVLGAGPAGVGAAVAASAAGVETVIVDRAQDAGGQVYRAPLNPALTRRSEAGGRRLRQALGESAADVVFACNVWSVGRDFRVDAIDRNGARTWRPKSLVAAVGTTERVIPFPGWTLPGVYGLAATTLMLKSQAMLPGEDTVVAGSGPLLAAVAHGIIAGGGRVAAVIDTARRGEWLRAAPALIWRPGDLWRGLEWLRVIIGAGVPVLFGHTVSRVRDTGNGLEVVAVPVDTAGCRRTGRPVRTIQADSLSVGNGLTPATELTRLLGATHVFDATAGGWVPRLDAGQRTSVEGLYVAGDGTGITGADAAFLEGKIAGYTAALDLCRIGVREYGRLTSAPLRRLRRVARAGRRMAGLMIPRPGQIAEIDPSTIVCRCEDVTRNEIDAAINDGACDLNQLKSWTRCGMGPCQGRTCGDVVAALVAARRGGRETTGCWTPRIPLYAVNMHELVGDFDYVDISIPDAAPL